MRQESGKPLNGPRKKSSSHEACEMVVVYIVAKNGIIVSCTVEDMWPFLEREEFFSNMLIAPVNQ